MHVATEQEIPSPNWLTVGSWALYDLANTVFSMNIVSLYFSLWVVNEMGGSDAAYGYANSFSMFLVLISAPLAGALSDQAGRRMPFLVISSLICIAFTALLGLGGLAISLFFFVIANYMFQVGLIFYEPLLTEVSTEETRGKISGFGVGLGYMGSFIGVGSGILLLDRIGYVGIFRLTALIFLIFALPCFFFVREKKRSGSFTFGLDTIRNAFQQVLKTIPHARSYRGLLRFLIGRFFYADAANTVIVFMGIYVTNELGYTPTEVQILLLVAIVAAVVGGFVWGGIVDKVGPKRTLNWVLVLWMSTMAGAILTATPLLPGELFWGVAILAGIALGGTWTADRPYMILLSPPKYLGEFYGLYSMIGRFASILGPLTWGIIVDALGWGRPAAIGSLLIFIVIGYIILQGVDDEPRNWPQELRV